METLLRQLTQGNALFLMIILGIGGSFHMGFHATSLSSPSPFIQSFINSSWFHRYEEPPPPQTVTMIWSLIVSMYALGGILGALSVKFVADRLGRKKTMICNSFVTIFAAGVVLSSRSAQSYEMVILARILYGYAAGLGQSAHLMYLAEISPRKLRGVVTLSSVTFGSIGKLSGQLFGLSELLGREDLWNVLLCVPAVFSAVQIVALPFLPEAPRYLFIEKGEEMACKKALQTLWGPGEYREEMNEMLAEQAALEAAPPKSALQLVSDRTVRWQLISMSAIYFCNQMSGMSAITIFSFDIFLEAGIPRDKIRYVTLCLGACEIVTTISCGLLIEQIGRRLLLWGGYGVMSACWVFVTVTLVLKDSSDWVSYLGVALMVVFIFFFCGGPGGATPTLQSEIFVQSDRMAAFVLMGMFRWGMFAVLGLIFPFLINALNSYCFLFFACVCLLGCVFTFSILPETKGKTLMEISAEFRAISVCGISFSEQQSTEGTKL